MRERKESVRQATFTVLSSYPVGHKFHSVDDKHREGLKYDVVEYLYETFGIVKNPNDDTPMRALREVNDAD